VRTIAIINQKGGCGKTTSAINLAASFAARSARTLLIDMDPQSHCAAGLGVPEARIDQDISAALVAPPDAALVRDRLIWRVMRRLDLVPSTMMLAGLEAARGGLSDQPDKERRLGSVIDRLARIGPVEGSVDGPRSRYDVCIIDCPPSIGLLSYNAIAAGREILIPVETSFFSLKGAAKQLQTIKTVARRLGSRPRPWILATMHDPSNRSSRDLLRELREGFGERVIPLPIRTDPELKAAARLGLPIERHAPGSIGAEDYRALCEWLMEHADIERAEPDDDGAPETLHASGPLGDPDTTPVLEPVGAAGAGPRPAGASRAQEMAQRAMALSTERRGPLRRSMMPHRPVAIEVSDTRVAAPAALEPISRVRHLLGVRAVTGGALFVQPLSMGERVCVAGSFNAWDPARGQMKRNETLGVYELHTPLAPGRHEYKLVIDGLWMLDPYNNDRAACAVGSENNTLEVGPRPSIEPDEPHHESHDESNKGHGSPG